MYKEKEMSYLNGFAALLFILALAAAGVYLISLSGALPVIGGIAACAIAFVLLTGLTIVQPNQAAVVTFSDVISASFAKADYTWLSRSQAAGKFRCESAISTARS